MLLKGDDRKHEIYVIFIFTGILVFGFVLNTIIIFAADNSAGFFVFFRMIGAIIVLSLFFIEQFMFTAVDDRNRTNYTATIRYEKNISNHIDHFKKIKEKITYGVIFEILKDLPRHNSFKYINKNSLSDEYFKKAYDTVNDENIYIVLSNTGSAASEVISIFTKKIYNHISISFDSNLETIISYNGGDHLYPPGLNHERIEWFNRKKDASLIIYKLAVSGKRKHLMIDKVSDINKAGNAYNMLGLILKFSAKPNILFCSQFIYKLLKLAEINYFEMDDGEVRPTDFIELDYYRKLNFAYEIKFNSKPAGTNTVAAGFC